TIAASRGDDRRRSLDRRRRRSALRQDGLADDAGAADAHPPAGSLPCRHRPPRRDGRPRRAAGREPQPDGGSWHAAGADEVDRHAEEGTSVYKWKYADGGARVISVYDTAGEDVQNLQTASNQQHLRSSNAIVLVLDPFIFPENRRLAKTKGIEQLGPENAHADLVDAL